MNLKSCYIAGFGRIHDFSYQFSDGLNCILEENGWGKTTFGIFIKAMFFGMEYSPRRKELTEREHYAPWDGGNYGGNIVFEIAGKQYRIERTFGKSDKEDTFRLFNEQTNRESEEYTEHIGEEIFELDRDSFEKSIFLPQDNLQTGMTDSLNAKMGDLATAKDDISNFDTAVHQVEEVKKNYTRSSKNPGKLTKIKQDIRECREMLEQLPAMLDAYEKQSGLLLDRQRGLNALEKEKADLTAKIADQSRKEQELGAYRTQKKQLEENQERLAVLDDFFAKGLPTPEEIKEKQKVERQLELDLRSLAERKAEMPSEEEADFLEKLFVTEVPNDEKQKEWEQKKDQLKNLRIKSEHSQMSEEDKNKLQELKFYFANKKPSVEEIADAQKKVAELAKTDGKISELEDAFLHLKKQKENEAYQKAQSRGGLLFPLVLAIILFAGAGAFLTLTTTALSRGLGILFAIAAALVIVLALLSYFFKKKKQKAEDEKTDDQLEKSEVRLLECRSEQKEISGALNDFLSSFLVSPTDSVQQMIAEIQRKSDLYERLLEEEKKLMEDNSGVLEDLSELQLALYTELMPYAEVYGLDLYHDACEETVLQKLKEDSSVYYHYKVSRHAFLEMEKDTKEAQKELTIFIAGFEIPDEVPSVQESLNLIQHNLDQYQTLSHETEDLKQKITAFEAKHAIHEETESVEELQQKQHEIDQKIAETTGFLSREKDELSTRADELSQYEDQQERLEELLKKEKEYQSRVDVLEKTLLYLKQAKENFLSRYMAPLQNGMKNYLMELYPDSDAIILANAFTLDMDLTIHFSVEGTTREATFLSTGYRDLTAFCARMALIGVLFGKEKPVLILDDPFTNLDQMKIQNAMEFLEELSRHRQIIYFTCHESRLPVKETIQ